MNITATYHNRELSLRVDDKRMIFDLLTLPYSDIFEYGDQIYNLEIMTDGTLWIGQDGVMQEYELKTE